MKLNKRLILLVATCAFLSGCSKNAVDYSSNEITKDDIAGMISDYFSEHKDEFKGDKGEDGKDGKDGVDGTDGRDGADGESGVTTFAVTETSKEWTFFDAPVDYVGYGKSFSAVRVTKDEYISLDTTNKCVGYRFYDSKLQFLTSTYAELATFSSADIPLIIPLFYICYIDPTVSTAIVYSSTSDRYYYDPYTRWRYTAVSYTSTCMTYPWDTILDIEFSKVSTAVKKMKIKTAREEFTDMVYDEEALPHHPFYAYYTEYWAGRIIA